MYSNLRTEEGHPNHVVPGITALALGGYQRDTVTVTALVWPDRIPLGARHLVLDPRRHLETAASWTTEPRPLRLPWTELRRTVMTWRDAGVHDVVLGYERAGRTRVVPDAIADPALSAPLPWAEEHLLAFRAVDHGRHHEHLPLVTGRAGAAAPAAGEQPSPPPRTAGCTRWRAKRWR